MALEDSSVDLAINSTCNETTGYCAEQFGDHYLMYLLN